MITDIIFGLYVTMGLSILATFTYFLLIKKFDEYPTNKEN